MQNQWRVIDCTDLDGSISYERGRMRVVKNDTGECVDVPLAQIAVVLLGLHVRCSAAVLHEMARYGVSVMLCDWRGVVPEFLRTLVFARPRGDDQFADCTFSPSLDMSR